MNINEIFINIKTIFNKNKLRPNILNSLFILQTFGIKIFLIYKKKKELNSKKKKLTLQNILIEKILFYKKINKYFKNKSILISIKKKIYIKYININYYNNWNIITYYLIRRNRYTYIKRNTKETSICLKMWLDDIINKNKINTGIYFIDHMINQIFIHSKIYINIYVKGDLYIDDHHIIEDTALVIGKAFKKSLNNKIGINRYGSYLSMDECLTKIALDISNRPYLKYNVFYNIKNINNINIEMIEHFFKTLSYSMLASIHIKSIGKNNHHKIENIFKAFGFTLRKAINIINNKINSSKGII